MDDGEKYSVEKALDEIFFMSRLVGTFPLDRQYKLTWRILVFFFSLFLSVVMQLDEFHPFNDNVRSFLVLFRWIIVMSPAFANFGCLYYKVERLKDFFKELVEFELFTHRIGEVWTYRYSWWNEYMSLMVIFTSIGSTLFDFGLTTIKDLIRRLSTYILFFTVVNQISGTTSLWASSIAHLKHIRDDRELLKKFDRLISLRRNVENHFGLQILFITAGTFVSAVSVTFFYLKVKMNLYVMANFYLFIATNLLAIYIPLLSVVSQERKINKMLYKRLLANPNDKILEFHMTAKRDFTFTAFGFFRINSSLIGSMIGAGTTYLVILLQYGK